MKKLIIIVVVLIVVAAGLPFLNGVLLERIIKNSVSDANAMYEKMPFGLSIEIADYNRSYLKTDIVYKVNMDFLKKFPDMESSFTIEENAKHGLFGVSSTTNLNGIEAYKNFVTEKLQGKDPLHIKTTYSILGGLDSSIVLDDFSIDVDKEKLNIKKAEINVKSDQKMKNYDATINWQGLDVDQKVSLEGLSMAMKGEIVEFPIMDGTSETQIKSIKILENGKEIEISDLNLKGNTDVDVDANTFDSEAVYSVGSIKADSKNIDGAKVRLAVKGIKLDTYREMLDLYFKTVSQTMANIDLNDPGKNDPNMMQKEMQQMSMKMVGIYEKLLKKDLELQISDVSVKLPEGEVTGGITLRLLKDMTFAQFLPVLSQPEDLFDALYIKTDINLPVALTGEAPQLTQPPLPAMKTGLFVKDGDFLVNHLETKDRKLILNGNEVPLNEIVSQINPGAGSQAGNSNMP